MQRKTILKNSLANFLGNAANKAVRILLVPLQINLLGEQAFGLIGFYTVLGTIIAFLDLGLTQTANREVARLKTEPINGKQEIRNLIRTFELLYWAVAIIIGLAIVFSSSWLALRWIKAPDLDPNSVVFSLNIMGILFAARWPVSLYQGILLGLERQVLKNTVAITIELINGFGSILILLINPVIELFFLWQLFVGIVEITGYVWFCWKSVADKNLSPPFFQISIIKRIWRFAMGVNIISIIGSIFGRADSLILSKLFTIDFLGYYSLAHKVTPLIGIFPGAIIPATTPSLIANFEHGNNGKLANIYHLETKLISFIGVGISLLLSIFSFPILQFWTQSDSTARYAYIPFSIIAAATVFESTTNPVNQLSLACGFTRPSIIINSLVGILVAVFTILLVPSFGIVGASIAWGISRIAMFLTFPWVVHKYILQEELANWYKKDTFPYILLGIFCAIVGILLNQYFTAHNSLYWLISFFITGTLYVGLVFALKLMPNLFSMIFSRQPQDIQAPSSD